MKLRESLL